MIVQCGVDKFVRNVTPRLICLHQSVSMGRFPWLKRAASTKSEVVTATGPAVPFQDADGKAGRRGFGGREAAKAPQAMDIDDEQERRDSLSNLRCVS